MNATLAPEVVARQKIERRIARRIILSAVAAGYGVGVYDGEEHVLKDIRNVKKLVDALMSVDDEYIMVYKDGKRYGWVRLIYGNGNYGCDVVCDHSTNLEQVMEEANKLADRLSTMMYNR